MKRLIVRTARRIMPDTVDRVADRVYASRQRIEDVEAHAAQVAERLDEATARLSEYDRRIEELQSEVDEARRDSLRIAQLADIVQQRLLQ